MIQFNPNLMIRRLVVFKSGKPVFDEGFHSGLNIIRGRNSSGKSTVMDFLFFALGGDIERGQWREAAARCDMVAVEVEINGTPISLLRDVEDAGLRPMRIFYGDLDQASKVGISAWETYPFKRTAKESFSQVLFRLLGLPDIEYGDANAHLTFNQVLRLLYSDQMSRVDRIFRPVSFDLAITRQAVADLLCGAYSQNQHSALLRKRAIITELQDIRSSIKNLIKSHKRDGRPLTLEWVETEDSRLQEEIDHINREVSEILQDQTGALAESPLSLAGQRGKFRRLQDLQRKVGDTEARITALELQISETDTYIASIERKLNHLQEAQSVVEHIGGLSFEFCPSCFAQIEEKKSDTSCGLCKSDHDTEKTKQRVLKLVNEYTRQISRANSVQTERRAELQSMGVRLTEVSGLWKQAALDYQASLELPSSELTSKLRQLAERLGYLSREQEELIFFKSVVDEFQKLSAKRETLENEIVDLDSILQSEAEKQAGRLAEARALISAQIIDFLHADLSRQDTFSNAQSVSFEFDGDRLSVDGESFFSASSMVYLRNSFFASFLYAAANDPSFMHPRILIMDTVEDKGMEPERSMNFQRLLKSKSEVAKSRHQIIIATSMIAPELDNPQYTVGKEYSQGNLSLDFVA